MEAKARSFTFLGNEGSVRVPFFQREYVWEKENWEDLLADLLDFSKTPFLGSLILKQETVGAGDIKEVQVIDGQQRLTTLSILLKSLYDSFSDDVKKNCVDSIRTYLFHKRDPMESKYYVKINHSHIDAAAFQAVIRSGIDEGPFNFRNSNGNRVLQCYKYYTEALKKLDDETRKGLFKRILHPENKMLVVIDLAKEDNEQAIFDTINSAGVRLSSSDIVKNALFQKVIQVFGSEKAIEIYDDSWKRVFCNDEETRTYWETPKLTGRLQRDNIEILLHCIAVIEGFYDPDKNTLSDLAKLYKERIATLQPELLKRFIGDITEYAGIYRKYFLAFDSTTSLSFGDNIQRIFHILDVLQISTFHPLILHLLKNLKDDEPSIRRILYQLEKLVIRRMICREETKSYNKLCKDLIENKEDIGAKLKGLTPDRISTGLRGITNKYATLLLFWVELHRKHIDNKYDTSELKYSYTLEHIMPQKWEEFWTELPEKKNSDGSTMTAEESKKDRYEKVYWIGNMTLLTSSLNPALRNYDFKRKMEGEGRKKGIRAYSAMSITKDIVSDYEKGDKTWDESKIINRTMSLEDEINSIWSNEKENAD